MKKLIFLVFFLLVLVVHKTALAQTDWSINEYHSDITLEGNGVVLIKETIAVDFATSEKHGIYRDIPISYQNGDGTIHYTKVEPLVVSRDGSNEQYSTEQNASQLQIKIGNPDHLISGEHIYSLSYRVTGVILPYSSYDEFYWNVTGNNWEVPIKKATATFHIAKPGILQTSCYQGEQGSTTPCISQQKDKQTLTFTTNGGLAPAQGLTIAVGFSKGIVPILTVTRPKTIVEQLVEPMNIAIFLVTLVAGLGLIFRTWWQKGRDFWTQNILAKAADQGSAKPIGAHEQIVVEFTSPDKLRPAELGLLVDERADTLDVTATIIDLARRGHLHITEVEKNWIFGKTDYVFKRLLNTKDNLAEYEKLLLSKLFDGKESVTLSSLKRNFSDDLQEVKKALYQDVLDKKLFLSNPETIRHKYMVTGALIAGVPVVLAYITGLTLAYPPLIAFGSAVAIAGVILLLVAQWMPRRSAYGRDLYRRCLGYRLFINKAETYRQQFYEKHNLFDEVLPYAIVFGLTEKFAKAFKDMDLKQKQPGWYTGYYPYNPLLFASSMNSFSQTLSSTMAATPKSSGSSGGGFSGGGFGGGGGGSW